MSRNGKVIVAMSGGVDSSVAACLLKEQGYECIGVFMRVGAQAAEPEACAVAGDSPLSAIANRKAGIELPQRRLKHGCCSSTDALDARLIAGKLGIPFYALNFEHDFGRIIEYFVDEYGRARTPNPCVMCNIHLKFGKLFRYAEMMEAEFVATGHYARILRKDSVDTAGDRSSGPFLARAVNRAKDQSYVLFGIQRADLSRCLFPLGEFADKADVRRIAADLGLRVHDKPDSQEICFVPENDYAKLYDERRPESRRPGELRDASGRVVGTHAGYQTYTIGQRRGLGVAFGRPMYVTRIDAAENAVVVGPREELASAGLIAADVNWLSEPSAISSDADSSYPCAIKIRHMHTPAAGAIRRCADGSVEAQFDLPQPAVTPGQAAVFYADDIVLGGGWIQRALP